jgi:flavin reductase (DIM6/NTAB) family NADH-FMN oxidoreductase RutF
VNLLAADQTNYSIGFSWGKSEDPFADFPWKYGAADTPVLTEAAAHFVGEIEKVEQYHGSAVVMARVIACDIAKDETLVYWQRAYFGGLEPVEGGVTGTW